MKTTLLPLILILTALTGYSQGKISEALMDDIQQARGSGTTIEALIVLNDRFNTQALDLQLTRQKATCHERGVAVVTALMEHAERTQAELISYLESRKGADVIQYQSFWIDNIIFVDAMPEALLDIAQHRDVTQLIQNEHIERIKPVALHPASRLPGHAEPGLKAINADKMWKLGFTGEGVIVGLLDTGVDGLHPALSGNWHGNSVPASQAWYDQKWGTSFPTDGEDGHGTHVTGIMSGLDPVTADTIGVAFGSEWICARHGDWTTQEFLNTFQWMADPDGNPETTEDMPAVMNNSWYAGHPSCFPAYIDGITNLEAAGVAVIFAAGNFGPDASTVTTPAKCNYTSMQVFSVGALDGNYEDLPIAPFSSRGPTECTLGGDQIKPEVSAPGTSVRSSFLNNSYIYFDGTSMAAPHVCGAIALLKQAFPEKTGNQLKQMLYETARDLGEPGEDNTYGMGVIDVYQAYIENAVPENPRPPSQVTAYSDYSTPSSVTISWNDPSTLVSGDPLENFEISIFRDNTLIVNIAAGVGSYTDTGLTDRQHYEYMAKTHDLSTGNMSIERKLSAWAGGSPVPSSPVILTGTFNPFAGITITWMDPTTQSDGSPIDDLAMIFIYRDQLLWDSVAPGTGTYTDGRNLTEQTYAYSLNAIDNETPRNFSQATPGREIFAGTRPDVLIYYGTAYGPVLDYVDSVYRAIRFFNIPVFRTNNLSKFGWPVDYDAVFVITGMYITYGHVLTAQDGFMLSLYLNNGGSVYMEGNMCFNSANVMAGGYNIRPWLGLDLGDWTLDPVTELSGLNEFSGMDFQYPGLGHVWDILNPATSTSTLWEDPGTGNIYGVYNEYNTGKIIGTVLPYGGMADPDSPENKIYLMCRYLEMLGIEVGCYVGEEESAVGGQRSAVSVVPNPVFSRSEIKYQISKSKRVVLKIVDVCGSEVCTLVNEEQAPGEYIIPIDASGLPVGIYLIRLEAGDAFTATKMVVIR